MDRAEGFSEGFYQELSSTQLSSSEDMIYLYDAEVEFVFKKQGLIWSVTSSWNLILNTRLISKTWEVEY